MDHRQLVRGLAAGRIVIGTALTVAPGLAGRGWIGDAALDPSTKVFTRALGVRDLALGLGAYRALDSGGEVRPWVVLGALCDAVDLVATSLAMGRIGARRAVPAMLIAGTAAAAGLAAADHLDA